MLFDDDGDNKYNDEQTEFILVDNNEQEIYIVIEYIYFLEVNNPYIIRTIFKHCNFHKSLIYSVNVLGTTEALQ